MPIRMSKSPRVHVEPNNIRMSTILQQQTDMIGSTSTGNESSQRMLRGYWYRLHRRYWNTTDIKCIPHDLLIARILAIFIWLYVIIFEFVAFSNITKPSITVLNFLFYSSYSLIEVYTIVYASGAAAYGVSIEIYIILPVVVVNSILAIMNCGMNHGQTIVSIIYIAKIIALFTGTELTHQNFKRFTYQQSYKLHCLTATRVMLRQAIYWTITIMFLVSPGLRAVYNAVRFKCSYGHKMGNESHCSLIDIEQPLFTENDSCIADYTTMVTSLEQLRIIRDISICNIAFYSMYNKAFLDISGTSGILHKIVLTLFVAMGCSFIAANIDPFQFNKFKLFFSLVEVLIFIIMIILLILNLRKKCKHRSQVIMEENPTIFG